MQNKTFDKVNIVYNDPLRCYHKTYLYNNFCIYFIFFLAFIKYLFVYLFLLKKLDGMLRSLLWVYSFAIPSILCVIVYVEEWLIFETFVVFFISTYSVSLFCVCILSYQSHTLLSNLFCVFRVCSFFFPVIVKKIVLAQITRLLWKYFNLKTLHRYWFLNGTVFKVLKSNRELCVIFVSEDILYRNVRFLRIAKK